MNQEWYYSVNGERLGPVAAAELKKLADAGTLKPADLVWKDGMADWSPAKSIKGLFGAAAAAGPAAAKAGEPTGARGRAGPADDDRPSRRGRGDDEDEDDRPSRRRRDADDEDEDRPSGRVRRRDADDEDDDRPSRRRGDDEDDVDEDRPRRRRSRVPEDVSSKKLVAGILGILLGWLGVHKFYLGMTGAGVIMLVIGLLTCTTVSGIIGLVEGIIYLTKSDEDFYQTYIVEQKAWF